MSRCRTSWFWYSHTSVWLTSEAVVPTPPASSSSIIEKTSSSVTGRSSTSCCSSALITSFCGLAAPRRDDLAHLLGQVRQLDLGRPLVLLAARDGSKHGVVSERVARPVLHRQAEPVDGHDRRHADDLGEVALAGLDHLIDEPRRVRRDQVRHPLDRGRRRERVDELAVLAELRRVDLDRDVQVHRRLRDDDRQPLAAVRVARRGEDVVVTRCLEHGVVARHDPVAAVRLGPGDRALLPQLAVRRDGVLGVLLGVVVELHLGLMGVRSRHAFRTSGQG